jgi:hypothetical protein
MKNILIGFCLLSIVFSFSTCKDDEDQELMSFTYDFEESPEGWTADFSDYPVDWDPVGLEFVFEHTDLPQETNRQGKSLMLSGRNISDDMFMFIKKQITGLKPNHVYQVRVRVQLASQYPETSVGIGGSPGGSVYLKAGGSTIEPESVEENGYILLNIDKGNQATGGTDVVLIGTVGIPGNEFVYTIVERDNFQQPVGVRTDGNGSLWIVVGTDSGFEGTSTLFYDEIEVRLQG